MYTCTYTYITACTDMCMIAACMHACIHTYTEQQNTVKNFHEEKCCVRMHTFMHLYIGRLLGIIADTYSHINAHAYIHTCENSLKCAMAGKLYREYVTRIVWPLCWYVNMKPIVCVCKSYFMCIQNSVVCVYKNYFMCVCVYATCCMCI
jgi:hypothetical protein